MSNGKTALGFGKRLVLILGFLIFCALASEGQKTMSLKECIEFAKDNSLSLKQSQYSIANAKLTDKQNQLNRLPNLSGSSSAGFQFGRTIDPTTNSFNNERISFQSFGVNFGATLYSGGRINNAIKQGKIDVEAAEADAEYAFNNLALNIANAYLQILMAEEQLENANKRRDLSVQQLGQTDRLIAAGTLPANDRLDVLALIARDEQAIVQAQNLIDINYLTIKELMQLDPIADLQIERPQVVIPADADPDANAFGETYVSALGRQPQIRRDELLLKSAEIDVDIAKAGMLPTLSIFGGMDSRWSSASKKVTGSTPGLQEQEVIFNGISTTVGFPVEILEFGNNPYLDQLDQNFGQNLGINLSVPIYSNGRNSINVQRAQVNILNSRLQSDLTKQQLKSDVQTAIANARAAKRTLDASQKSLDANQVAYDNSEKRFRLGTINNLQLTTARNNLDIAQTDLTVAKYDYLFKLKIIDFYLGRELKLD